MGDAGCTRALASWSLAFWALARSVACLTKGKSRRDNVRHFTDVGFIAAG